MEKKTLVAQSIVIGSVAAIMESLVNHPLWAWKLRMQSGAGFTANPFILYRGLAMHMLSRIPTTAAQISFSRLMQENLFLHSNNPMRRDLLSGLFGGFIAALIQGPSELVMTYQHKYGKNFYYQYSHILSTRGAAALFTGYSGTAIRLGTYTCSFFAAQPLMRDHLINHHKFTYWKAHILSAVFSGSCSAIISNPADVIKTVQQDQLPVKKLSFPAVAREIYKTLGPAGFFRGTIARMARVCSGIGVISYVSEQMQKNVFSSNH